MRSMSVLLLLGAGTAATSELGCRLGDEMVPHGWSGNGVGFNHCNRCNCNDGRLACTRMFCPPQCTLTGGEGVPAGWSGHDTGSNSCNRCFCTGNGMLGCTRMACNVPRPRMATTVQGCMVGEEHVQVGWSGSGAGSNHCNTCMCLDDDSLACTRMGCPMCQLAGGEQVAPGWFGQDTGANSCNKCWCFGPNALLACTRRGCNQPQPRMAVVATGCTLTGGESVELGWSGKDTGANYCNSCRCFDNGALGCTRMGCAPVTAAPSAAPVTCTLTGGDSVAAGWSGMDTGANSCNRCFCTPTGLLACTRKGCNVPQPRMLSTIQGCMVGDENVEVGWSGNGAGSNFCNRCWCLADGALACTRMACPAQASCTFASGDVVEHGYSGKGFGHQHCNTCNCNDGALSCTRMFCPTCELTGGERVAPGWSGHDTGANSCNSCFCTEGPNPVLGCTLMGCFSFQPRVASVSPVEGCTLSDGQVKPVGWAGNGAGSNHCNKCRCMDNGALACTRMGCPALTTEPSTTEPSTSEPTDAPRSCTFSDGEVVAHGYSGKGFGSQHCNTCSCSDGALACTRMFCPTCQLTGGERVAPGWTGRDTGANSCNRCFCTEGFDPVLGCTRMACNVPQPRMATTVQGCTVGEEHVQVGWSGNGAGNDWCNRCRCLANDALACTRMMCPTQEPSQCQLTGGEMVDAGWSGKDTGSNCCNRCTCHDDGALACTRRGCQNARCRRNQVGGAAARDSEAEEGGVSTGVWAGAGAGLLAVIAAAAGCVVVAKRRSAASDSSADYQESLTDKPAGSKKPCDV